MLGAIIGDIVGSRFEFNPTNNYNFELFSDKCSFTDDTICTIAVADAILRGIDYGASIHHWCRKYPHPMGGYGASFRNWVMSEDPKPYGSYGNGSAMRVSPIGWWFDDPDELKAEAFKSAECTHSHAQGILGAQAVTLAVSECRQLRRRLNGEGITPDKIRWDGLNAAIRCYTQSPAKFNLDLKDYRNQFDETCQRTVPPALWIVLNSTSFEDAIRQAVSLGADADTIGAIVGSIAEALWGIPEWIKQKALSYLPDEMVKVITAFNLRLNRRRKLSRKCQYYLVGEYRYVHPHDFPALNIEKAWVNDLAKSYHYADKIKALMFGRFPAQLWQAVADEYGLPVSLVGYVASHTIKPFDTSLSSVTEFLDRHYGAKKAEAAKEKEAQEQIEQFKAVMFWKLGLGDMNKLLMGEDPLPDKSKVATADMVPESQAGDSIMSLVMMADPVTAAEMEILKKGHIPDVMEDHWFMYCDDEYIRYYRSWTGMLAFEAHYVRRGDSWLIDSLTINQGLAEFGVNGDAAGTALFRYLVAAETGGDAEKAWNAYLSAWEKLNSK